MEDIVWKKYGYKVCKGTWGIAILIEAGYGPIHSNCSHSNIIYLEHGIYVQSLLRPYPKSQPLSPHELHCFCDGVQIVAKQIRKASPYSLNTLISLRSVQFSECGVQDEAFTAAAMEWSSETFQFKAPNYQVSFEQLKGRSGSYIFDFAELKTT